MRCAREHCEEPVKAKLTYVIPGLAGVVTLAYACSLPHFKEVMYATYHLGEHRIIGEVEK